MKGIIADVRGNKAVLLNEQGAFCIIKNQNFEIGQEINHQPRNMHPMMAIASCFLVIMLFSLTGYAYYTPVSYMSIDINPSLQLEINRFNQVISLKPFNEDGEILVKSISKSQDINQTIDLIITHSKDMGYLTDGNNYVAVDILSGNQKFLDRVNQTIQKYKEGTIEIAIEYAKPDDLHLSKEYDISLGRAKAVMEYSEVFGGTVKENAKQLALVPVKEIKKSVLNKKASGSNKDNETNEERLDNAKKDKTNTEKKGINKEEEKAKKETERIEEKETKQKKQEIKEKEKTNPKQEVIKEKAKNNKNNQNKDKQKQIKQKENAAS